MASDNMDIEDNEPSTSASCVSNDDIQNNDDKLIKKEILKEPTVGCGIPGLENEELVKDEITEFKLENFLSIIESGNTSGDELLPLSSDCNRLTEAHFESKSNINGELQSVCNMRENGQGETNLKCGHDYKQNERGFRKRNSNPKVYNGRDSRRRYNNQSRRGRFYGNRRRSDCPQYRVFPPHIPPSLGTVQDIDIPPPDPLVLQAIDNDPVGVVRIADGMKEVRFYGESAIVMLDWDDPKDIFFQPGSRRVIIDDLDIITLPFNAPYTSYTLYDGRTINIRLGAPTRDLYIDGKYYDARFGGPPIEVPIDGTYHRIQLGGPLPHMCLGSTKRTDLVAGRITLIVDEKVHNVVYLDSKPQKFELNGVPFILKFEETLKSALINGKSFKIEFGGVPVHISCYGEVHSLRFSSLPLGVVPGYVNFIDLDYQASFDPLRSAQILDALSIRQPSSSQDFHNYHYHYHYHCSSQDNQQFKPLPNILPQTGDITPAIEYKVLLDPPNLSGKVIDVNELFRKLVEKGIVPASTKPETPVSPVSSPTFSNVQLDFSRPETLKCKNLKLIRDLHRGNQCNSCGMRFVRRDTSYINHLRYHEEDGKPNEIRSKRWWSHTSEFLMEFDEDLPSWFKRNGKLEKHTEEKNDSIISVGGCDEFDEDALCICCDENFEELPEEMKKECCVTNVVENENSSSLSSTTTSESNDVVENDKKTISESSETIIIDDSSVEGTTNDDGLVDIASEEELEPGEIVDEPNETSEPDVDILEVVEIKPKIETIELSDDEIEEGEIVDAPEPIPLMDIDFSKIRIKKEKLDDGYYRRSSHQTERWSLDGNSEYVSANLVKPRKIKVNISSVQQRYYKRKEPRRRERRRQERPEVEPRPASIKPRIARSNLSVNISKIKGKESSALCSLM